MYFYYKVCVQIYILKEIYIYYLFKSCYLNVCSNYYN